MALNLLQHSNQQQMIAPDKRIDRVTIPAAQRTTRETNKRRRLSHALCFSSQGVKDFGNPQGLRT